MDPKKPIGKEKLELFNAGVRRKTAFERHREEQEERKKREEREADLVYKEFVASFERADSQPAPRFVRASKSGQRKQPLDLDDSDYPLSLATSQFNPQNTPQKSSLPSKEHFVSDASKAALSNSALEARSRSRSPSWRNSTSESTATTFVQVKSKSRVGAGGGISSKALEQSSSRSRSRSRSNSPSPVAYQPEAPTVSSSSYRKKIEALCSNLKRKAEEAQPKENRPRLPLSMPKEQSLPYSAVSTNIYAGNLNPKVNEDELCTQFAKYGPIASVKIMWPRTAEEISRMRNSGFVCYMDRASAQRAMHGMQGVEFYGYTMRLDWGKPVNLPQKPYFVSEEFLRSQKRDLDDSSGESSKSENLKMQESALDEAAINAQVDAIVTGNPVPTNTGSNILFAPPTSVQIVSSSPSLLPLALSSSNANSSEQIELKNPLESTCVAAESTLEVHADSVNNTAQLLAEPDQRKSSQAEPVFDGTEIRISIPDNTTVLSFIHRTIESVLKFGYIFEVAVISLSPENPSYIFLHDVNHPFHHYYRWRLYSLLQGDTIEKWRTIPFRMIEGGPVWIPPSLSDVSMSMSLESSNNINSKNGPNYVGSLSETSSFAETAKRIDSMDLSVPENIPSSDEDLETEHYSRTASRRVLRRLAALLVRLDGTRGAVARAMALFIDASEAAGDLCFEFRRRFLKMPVQNPTAQLNMLYLANDVLQNSTAPVGSAWRYHKCFEAHLVPIMRHMAEAYNKMRSDSKWKAENWRRCVFDVLAYWRQTMLYPREYIAELEVFFRAADSQQSTVDGTESPGGSKNLEKESNVQKYGLSSDPVVRTQFQDKIDVIYPHEIDKTAAWQPENIPSVAAVPEQAKSSSSSSSLQPIHVSKQCETLVQLSSDCGSSRNFGESHKIQFFKKTKPASNTTNPLNSAGSALPLKRSARQIFSEEQEDEEEDMFA